ncbi:MAG: hypothetical protein GY913_08080 [Proteobacteria bacterium]|nr:hypothetical protein [Pseudomonadota bacterium]MCP4916869.1 hypothetical protein [Pseudomonadota bacterium]
MLFLLPGLLGCNVGELSQPSEVDRTRVLGIKATPAEPAPGEAARIRSLAVDPVEGIQTVIYFGCLITESDSFGCEDLEVLGTYEPGGPVPSFTTPEDALDGMTDEEKEDGLNYLLQFLAVPNGVDLETALESEDADAAEIGESGFKRVPVSLNSNPNDNPKITGLRFDDAFEVENGDTLVLTHGQTYDIEVLLSADSVQDYVYTNSDGETEDRTEEPYFSFHATQGDVVNPWSLYPFGTYEYTAPVDPDPSDGQLWIVTRDRRGGQDWIELNLRFE